MLYVWAKDAIKLAGCALSPLCHRLSKIAGIVCYWVWRSKRLVTLRNMAQAKGQRWYGRFFVCTGPDKYRDTPAEPALVPRRAGVECRGVFFQREGVLTMGANRASPP